jgi:hypothetical protein
MRKVEFCIVRQAKLRKSVNNGVNAPQAPSVPLPALGKSRSNLPPSAADLKF